MWPAAVTQQNHHPAEESKWSDLEAARMKMERLMCTIILARGNNSTTYFTVETQCERVCVRKCAGVNETGADSRLRIK